MHTTTKITLLDKDNSSQNYLPPRKRSKSSPSSPLSPPPLTPPPLIPPPRSPPPLILPDWWSKLPGPDWGHHYETEDKEEEYICPMSEAIEHSKRCPEGRYPDCYCGHAKFNYEFTLFKKPLTPPSPAKRPKRIMPALQILNPESFSQKQLSPLYQAIKRCPIKTQIVEQERSISSPQEPSILTYVGPPPKLDSEISRDILLKTPPAKQTKAKRMQALQIENPEPRPQQVPLDHSIQRSPIKNQIVEQQQQSESISSSSPQEPSLSEALQNPNNLFEFSKLSLDEVEQHVNLTEFFDQITNFLGEDDAGLSEALSDLDTSMMMMMVSPASIVPQSKGEEH